MRAGWPLWRLHIGSAVTGATFARTPVAAKTPAAAQAGGPELPVPLPSLWARVRSPPPPPSRLGPPPKAREGGLGAPAPRPGRTRQRTVARQAATPNASTWAMPDSSMATSGFQADHTGRAGGSSSRRASASSRAQPARSAAAAMAFQARIGLGSLAAILKAAIASGG